MSNFLQSGLQDVFVLKDSGECVYHKEFGNESTRLKSDGTIVSSLLSTIGLFAESVDSAARSFETANFRFVYHKKDDFLYVARTTKNVPASDIMEKLSTKSQTIYWYATDFDLGYIRNILGIPSRR